MNRAINSRPSFLITIYKSRAFMSHICCDVTGSLREAKQRMEGWLNPGHSQTRGNKYARLLDYFPRVYILCWFCEKMYVEGKSRQNGELTYLRHE
jgi:hypothetical protein